MTKLILLTVLLLLAVSKAEAQNVTLGNNLIYDAWLTPNLRVGVRTSEHWSLGLTAGYRPWPTSDETSRKWRHLLLSPELRYWKDSVNVHHFFGANLIYSHFNVAGIRFPFGLYPDVRNERRQGDLFAIGAFYGYSWPLGRHWNLEALIGAAVGYAKYDRYACGQCGTKISDESKIFVMPQAAINIVYNIPGRPRKQPVVVPVEPIVVPEPVVVETKPFVFVPAIHAVPDFTGRAGQLQRDNPVLAHISQYKPYDRTRILRKEKGALYVHFDQGKSVLHADYRDNAPTLERIVDITRQIMADTTSSVKTIQIVGLASIEGGIAANEQLAQNRALAMQRYLQQQVSAPDSLFDTVGGGEAWAEFRDQLEDEVATNSQHSVALQQALAVIDGESDLNQREQKLRQLNKGRTWQYLKDNILKDQRNSGYIHIYYDYVPDTAAKAINRASELIAQGQYGEALTLLNSVRSDERAQNALGVALWQTGQQEEALRCFRRAAQQGNADAQENLRQLENRTK